MSIAGQGASAYPQSPHQILTGPSPTRPPTPPSVRLDAASRKHLVEETPAVPLHRRRGIRQPVHPSRRANTPDRPEADATGTPTRRVSDRVIVVLGYHQTGDDGLHGISAICRAAVRRAELLAAEATPRAVIFTGWSSNGGPTEADQMAAEWKGRRDVTLIREPRAVNTAENAVRSLEILHTIDGAADVITVCSILHRPRVRFLFHRLYKQHGYSIGYSHVASPVPSPRLLLAELSSITRMVRDRRKALRLLNDMDSKPLAQQEARFDTDLSDRPPVHTPP